MLKSRSFYLNMTIIFLSPSRTPVGEYRKKHRKRAEIKRTAQKKTTIVFFRLYRVQIEGKKVHPDHGLGLCSVKQLVKEMDGSVTFRSTEGFGSIFIITLP